MEAILHLAVSNEPPAHSGGESQTIGMGPNIQGTATGSSKFYLSTVSNTHQAYTVSVGTVSVSKGWSEDSLRQVDWGSVKSLPSWEAPQEEIFQNVTQWLSSSSETDSEGGHDYLSPFDITYIRLIFIILYSTVFACCFLGNLLVIFVVLGHRKMRTTTNFFLANLAVADLMVGIFCVLPNLSLYLSPYWKLGRVMCKLLYFVQMTAYAASITILTVISIERYFAILHPLRSKTLKRLWLLRAVVLAIWVASAAAGSPHLIFYDTVTITHWEGPEILTFCIAASRHFNKHVYVTTNFVVWYLMPLFLMSVMYFRISVVLWRTSTLDRMSGNVLKHWRQHKKVKYSCAPPKAEIKCVEAVEAEEYLARPRISIEDEDYLERSTSPTPTAVEDAPNRTCPDTVRSFNSHSHSLAGASTTDGNLSEEGNPDPNAPKIVPGLVPFRNQVPPRKGSSANPNRLTTIPDYVCLADEISRCGDDDPSPDHEECPTIEGHQNDLRADGQQPRGTSRRSRASDMAAVVQRVSTGWSNVVRKVRHRNVKWPWERGETALLARRRVVRLLIAVVLCFAVCVFPYHLQMLLHMWGEVEANFSQMLVAPITFLIFYANSALNPILYAFLSDNFRKSLWELIRNRTRRHSSGQPVCAHAPKATTSCNRTGNTLL